MQFGRNTEILSTTKTKDLSKCEDGKSKHHIDDILEISRGLGDQPIQITDRMKSKATGSDD